MSLIPRQFLQGSIFTAVSALLTGIFGYLSRRFMANFLSANDYAFFYSALALVSISTLFIHFGTADVILYELPWMLATGKKRRAKSTYYYVCKIQQMLSLVCFSLFLVLTPILQKYYFDYEINIWYLWLMFAMLWGFALESTTLFALNSQKKFITVSILRMAKSGFFLLVILLAIFTSHPLLWIIVSLTAITTICTFIASRLVTADGILKGKTAVPRSIRQSVIGGGLIFMIISGGYMLMQDFGTFSLALFSSSQEVVLFNIALPIAMIVISFAVVLNVFTSMIADSYRKGEKYRVQKIFRLLFGITGLAMICAFPILFWGGKWIIGLLFSQKFVAAHTCTIFMVEAAILSIPVRAFLTFFNVVGQKIISVKSLIPAVVVALIAYPLLSFYYGATGAGIATFLTTGTWLAANIICYVKFLYTWRVENEP